MPNLPRINSMMITQALGIAKWRGPLPASVKE